MGLQEIIEKTFGRIDHFKSKNELLEEEFDKFIIDYKPDDAHAIIPMKYFFKAYITDNQVRDIIERKDYVDFNTNPTFTTEDFLAVPQDWRNTIPEYVKDYIPLNQFML
ncbi:hypothetical protein BHECKSOX_865 [Bathymodiolus heckerae thiotrophic gill symbiont]|uniref:hypothetical protein n=1 Tax=Bathymodiolus heckerae thiotrophic gill symbiont TaxID=1052212 RepID=UPI0010B36551|nr:hypothetical protein [Bathymodiolus heckerae thiotrophic gill symbiont]SHN92458.1 hypothetical protein BHECKSOX_865 [Bathymodiolus heckerae thiotrophic gill symbiont]